MIKVIINNLGEERDYRSELLVTHRGQLIAEHSDGGESEDNYFNRDWSWVAPLLDKVYTLGVRDGMVLDIDCYKMRWDIETCECKGEPPLGSWCGTCKICNRGEGMIFVSKATGKKYWTDKEDDKYLIPRIPLMGPEQKYGQNWDKELHMCPRCVDAVPVFYEIYWKSAKDYSDDIEIHCQKCKTLGHKDGTYIKTVDWLTRFRSRGYFTPVN